MGESEHRELLKSCIVFDSKDKALSIKVCVCVWGGVGVE